MSRTKALWISAILTVAIVLVAGTMLLRPTASRSPLTQAQPVTSLTGDAAASQLNAPAPQVNDWYQGDDHDQYEHHESNKEHEDDD